MGTPRIQSVDRAFLLLTQVSAGATSLPTIAQRSGLSVATAHRLLSTLESLGVIVRADNAGYRIGMAVHELAGRESPKQLLAIAAVPLLRRLVRMTGLTAHAGVLDDELMVDYVAREAPPRGYRVPTQQGSRLEAYCSGLGKVLLAAIPEDALEEYLASGPLIALTARTIVDPAALRAELAAVRARGHAIDEREMFDDLRCVAVPICNGRGAVVAALSLSGNSDVLTTEQVAVVFPQLQELAGQLAGKLFPSGAAIEGAWL